MKLCVLDNDLLDPAVAGVYTSYGAMFVRLLRQAGADWSIDIFNTVQGHYPDSFDAYEAVLLTGSRADAFAQDAWVLALRQRVAQLLQAKKKLVGVCFGHQLIALCLSAPVGRAAQGWGSGRMCYQWHGPALPAAAGPAPAPGSTELALLASHQDQVLALPPGATLLASSDFCPIAAYALGQHVFCVQGHPEFVEDYSAYLLDKRRTQLGEAAYRARTDSLALGHDGLQVARMMVAFVERPNR